MPILEPPKWTRGEHYREAERLLSLPSLGTGDDPRDPVIVTAALTHATLATAPREVEWEAHE